jgi:hypothetical protein
MTNVDAMKLLSPRTKLLLREHAKIIGVDEAKLASDLLEMMAQDALSNFKGRTVGTSAA